MEFLITSVNNYICRIESYGLLNNIFCKKKKKSTVYVCTLRTNKRGIRLQQDQSDFKVFLIMLR